MRGLVMILMTVDHASEVFNGGRWVRDASPGFVAGTPIPPAQFLTRWATHLCAPTFVLLAGTALALSTSARAARGESTGAIDRHLAMRGLILIALEPLWMTSAFSGWRDGFIHGITFQVLYAIGASFLLMVPLRRLGDVALLATGALLVVLDEPMLAAASALGVRKALPVCLLLGPGSFPEHRLHVSYPVLPWLGIMCLGWVFGRRLLAWSARNAGEVELLAARTLAFSAVALGSVFLVVRGVNGFGNMQLLRDDGSLLSWLHTSKYPPSLAYDACELSLAAAILAGLFHAVARWPAFLSPVRELGQAALFYYLLHLHLMAFAAMLMGWRSKLELPGTWLAALVTVVVLGPIAGWYARYKAAHGRDSVLQYL
jgi:uncharacterized membrane protein